MERNAKKRQKVFYGAATVIWRLILNVLSIGWVVIISPLEYR